MMSPKLTTLCAFSALLFATTAAAQDAAGGGDAATAADTPTDGSVAAEEGAGDIDLSVERTPADSAPDVQDASAQGPTTTPTRPLRLGLGLGAGIGVPADNPVVYEDITTVSGGLAFAPPHFVLQVDIPVGDRFSVLVQAGGQLVFLSSGIELNPRIDARGRMHFGPVTGISGYAQAGLGYGLVSHLVELDAVITRSDGAQARIQDTDRTESGPVRIGAGGGMQWNSEGVIGIEVDGYLYMLVPEVGVQLDVTAALTLSF